MLDTLQKNKDITQLSNFKTPASARWYFELNNMTQLSEFKDVIVFAHTKKLPILLLWWWTNMLFAFDTYEGIVIKNNLTGWNYDSDTQILETYSNESIWQIAESLENDCGQDLWHRFIWLPGSVGWAIFGNAGCFGLEIQHNFLDCEVLNISTWEVSVFTARDMQFEYRSSRIKKNNGKFCILKARFDLSQKREKYSSDVDNIYFREHQQPKWNSCGSFFKNPSRENSAGSLIEWVGLKWYHHGWAYFSEKHANFLMHDGTGRHQDLLQLIDLALQKVKDTYTIDLENEVRIIRNP